MKTIAFFNNKGGVGKTSLVFHLAWMFSELDYRVVAADFDPQANSSTSLGCDGEQGGSYEMITGMLAPEKRLGAKPMTASNRSASTMPWRIFPSAPPRKRTRTWRRTP